MIGRREINSIYSSIYLLSFFGFILIGLMIGSWFSPWSYKNCSSSKSCNDFNPCTLDNCINFICVHSLIENATCSDSGMCEDNQICTSDCQCTSNLILSDFISDTCEISLCEIDEIIEIISTGTPFSLPGNLTTFILIDSIREAPDVQSGNQRFGSAVVACDEFVFVGSEMRSSSSGAVYIYEVVEMDLMLLATEIQILVGPTQSNLGFSLSVSENCTYLVAGAPDLDPGNLGGFIIYKRNESTSPIQYDLFQTVTTASTINLGNSIKISNNSDLTIISGDPQGNNAKVFDYDAGMYQWILVQTITGNDTTGGNLFGTSLDIIEDTAVIGAINQNSRGAAYVFKRSGGTWVNTQKIIGSANQNGDDFGSCVALYENYAAIGSVSASRFGISSGGAYLFLDDSGILYNEIDSLFPSSLGSSADFGSACSFSNEGLLIIGAPEYDVVSGINTGIAIIYGIQDDQLAESYRLSDVSIVANGRIGSSVFINNNLTLAGAPTYSIGGTSSGIILIRSIGIPVTTQVTVECFSYFPTVNSFRLWCKGDIIGEFSPGVYSVIINGSGLPFNSSAVLNTWNTFTAYGKTESANSLISVSNPQVSSDNVFTAFIITYGTEDITVVSSTLRRITSKIAFVKNL